MFRDKTLIPTEAIRVLALGLLAERPRRYGALAQELRRFIGLVLGPSLEMLAPSLELLRYEGLAEAQSNGADAELAITERGRAELATLLRANLRAPVNDTNRLVIALKFRFLHLLADEEQKAQLALLADLYETERGRLEELRAQDPAASPAFAAWLDHEIALAGERIGWVKQRLLCDTREAPKN
jgi:DNA-binding PadR family transcriptional regulator